MNRPEGAFTNVFRLMAAFVATSMVFGLLAAGLAIPIVGGAGLGAKVAAATFDSLPATLTTPVMAQQTRIESNDGTLLATLFTENRTVVPLDQVSPIMRKAQIAIEDDRFYEHGGIDTRGIMRAFVVIMRGGIQGASTITQQYVRQSLIANALRNGNNAAAEAAQSQRGVAGIVRKLQEAKYAIELEKKMSKDQILEGYLNLVFYGANAYGVQAAAQRYFGVDAKDLNLQQSAMIAGMAQLPSRFNPIDNSQSAATKRRNTVIDRMAELTLITRAEAAKAKAAPLGLDVQPLKKSCESAVDKWVCLYVQKWLVKNVPALGKDEAEREITLLRGGLTVRTTFDAKLLGSTRQILTDWVPPSQQDDVGTAAAVVQPGTGKILSIGQSSQQDNDLIWSIDQAYGSSGGFQIGSTAKMYAVVTALKKGMSAETTLYAPPSGTYFSANQLHAGDCGMSSMPWPVGNVEGTIPGAMSLRSATVYSVNTAFADLATKIGICPERDTMKDMGLRQADGQQYGTSPSSIVLGANNASPLTMAASFASLAAGGQYCEPYPVDSITRYDGSKLDVPGQKCRDTGVSPSVAYRTTQILRGVVGANALDSGRDSAAKTGTSDGSSHTWMVGYTPQLSTAVWTGRTLRGTQPMEGIRIGQNYFGNPYGATLSGPSWRKIMNAASAGMPLESFKIMPSRSDGKIIMPDLQRATEQEARSMLRELGLVVESTYQPSTQDGIYGGQVISTSPSAGTEVKAGSAVTLTVASWQQPAPAPYVPPVAPVNPGGSAPAPPPRPRPTSRPVAPAPAPGTPLPTSRLR
ncbi:Biosynthetic peptidoglycan transglycosylase [Austwickia sp. TVS 96-490-7B]|uniref:penicillin-binding protein n=1 Tax=Austwickia sp. TVS 96-490-7B TaxID=2830843 RepID=UPI001C570058|nr:penicillin-binding protein [Austwickia sp. TVS 96-490-7B]MBW3084932.1 Biosynthetic peptidoglycan transglycosylase [Austwickia sp. TVS 96-490-7B]